MPMAIYLILFLTIVLKVNQDYMLQNISDVLCALPNISISYALVASQFSSMDCLVLILFI